LKKYFLFLALILSTFIFTGCESMMQAAREDYRQNTCNYDGAYKAGINDAQSAQRMRPDVSQLCDAQDKAAVEKGYREGYTTYLKTAPQKVEVNVNSPNGYNGAPVYGGYRPTSNCKSLVDCPSGKFCRDRGDGIHLCLGHEPRGGFCENSTDCNRNVLP
jgi:hypothetical protein